jgi:acyl carrier protein phosphodiesterase
MDRRTNSKSGMTHAVDDLIAGYQDFQDDFSVFFPEIISHINRFRCNL